MGANTTYINLKDKKIWNLNMTTKIHSRRYLKGKKKRVRFLNSIVCINKLTLKILIKRNT